MNAAVIGLGVGEQHALSYLNHPAVDSLTLYDMDSKKLNEVANRFPDAAVAGSYEEILNNPQIDIVSIASYDGDHGSEIIGALRHGKHVFAEKPLTRDLIELSLIREELKQNRSLHLGTNFVLREADYYKWLKEEIGSGSLGNIYAFDGDYLYGRLHKITNGWRGRENGYSPIHGGVVHLIDLFLWLFNEKPLRLQAFSNKLVSNGSGYRYDDYVTIQTESESGMIARFTMHLGCVHPHQHVVKVYGSKQTLLYDDQGPRRFENSDEKLPPGFLKQEPLPSSKRDVLRGFIDDVISGKSDGNDLENLLANVCICEAAHQSIEEGKTVEIKYR